MSSIPLTHHSPSLPREPRAEVLIEPQHGWINIDWQEIWRARELLFYMVWRDVKVRYKQTILGAAWVLLQPLFNMVVFTLIFGKVAKLNTTLPEGLQDKYAIFVFAALLPWTFISSAVSTGGLSLVSQQHLLTKIYFPRLFVPSSAVGSALFDMGVAALVMAALAVWYQVAPTFNLLLIPLLVMLSVTLACGVAYLFAALTVTFRDLRFLIPFLIQAWMFLSPVAYPTNLLAGVFTGPWSCLSGLNPVAGIISGFRSACLGIPLNVPELAVSALVSVALLIFGLFYFRRTERRFADIA